MMVEIRCPECNALLIKVEAWAGTVEAYCPADRLEITLRRRPKPSYTQRSLALSPSHTTIRR